MEKTNDPFKLWEIPKERIDELVDATNHARKFSHVRNIEEYEALIAYERKTNTNTRKEIMD